MEAGNMDFSVSVREVVDFLCRSGSLDSRAGVNRMVEGTRLHNIIMSRAGEEYIKEVPLEVKVDVDGLIIGLSGRADGIIDEEDGYTIDEIKTTTMPLRFIGENDYPAHWAQVGCYAFMFCELHNIDFIRTRITYANVETESCIYFYRDFTRDELREKVTALLREYKKWLELRRDFTFELQASAAKLKFPFPEFREGQSDMILAAYRAAKKGERLICEAPTGIGKTISTIYPSVKALGDGIGKRIFYLTAKTPLRIAAKNAVDILRKKGLRMRSIILTAKEKCCLCRDAVRDCDQMKCPYSENHFNSVNDAMWELLNGFESFDEALIRQFAEKYKVCPYELSLDISLWCGIIICDYNYLFDPRVSLRRFFGTFDDISGVNPEDNILLIDEAHNLPDRARDMYSAEVRLAPFLEFYKKIKETDIILYSLLRALCKEFLRVGKAAEKNGGFLIDKTDDGVDNSGFFEDFSEAVERFIPAAREWIRYNRDIDENDPSLPSPDRLLELLGDARKVQFAAAHTEKGYARYATFENTETPPKKTRAIDAGSDKNYPFITIKYFCIDPSELLSERLFCARSAVMFSATLSPTGYFAEQFGAGKGAVCRKLALKSPFPRENLFVGVMDKISTRLNDRNRTVEVIAELIKTIVRTKNGNYIVYFPSYRLMLETCAVFTRIDPATEVISQKRDMSEADRNGFVSAFRERKNDENKAKKSLVGFAVLGGIFSEGIDLVGERLIGSIIVGVGLWNPTTESNLLAEYYQKKCEKGFEYAYACPGMGRVMQAAGRVIRTDTDKGIVILIDDRYTTQPYVNLLPKNWKGLSLIGDVYSLKRSLERFWDRADNEQ